MAAATLTTATIGTVRTTKQWISSANPNGVTVITVLIGCYATVPIMQPATIVLIVAIALIQTIIGAASAVLRPLNSLKGPPP